MHKRNFLFGEVTMKDMNITGNAMKIYCWNMRSIKQK